MTNRPTEDNLEKSLPSSPGAERAVLGAVLVTPSVMDEVSAKLAREDFYLQAHRMIFEVAGSLWRDSATVDIVTVVEELTMSGNLESVGGASYVSGLCDGVARSSSVSSYIGIIKEKSRLRRIISISNGILQKALGGEASSSEILAEMEGSCQPLVSSSSAFKSAGEVVNSQQGAIERILSNEPPVRGIPTGYHQLDRLLFGLQPSTLTVVAGRPSAGKSTFSLNVCEHVSMVLREPVALFSLEDSEESIFLRMVSSLSKASSTKLRSGFAGNLDKSAVVNSCARIAESPLWLDCSSSMTIAEMKMKARRIVREHGVKLIVLDYLQLATAGFKTENRNIEVGLISQALKAIAKELHVCVMGLSQLSRDVEKRGRGSRPVLSDLRESGAIEQNADVVIFIHREELTNPTEENMGIAEVIVAKQRNGPLGRLQLAFHKELTRFENMADER